MYNANRIGSVWLEKITDQYTLIEQSPYTYLVIICVEMNML